MKLEAPPKVAMSKKGTGDQKAKQSTSGKDNSDPYLVGVAVEGLREALVVQGDGMIIVSGPSHTKVACPSTALSPKKTRKPPPSPMKVNSQGGQVQDASTKVRCKGNKEPLRACRGRESQKFLICNVYGTLLDFILIAECNRAVYTPSAVSPLT
jgi:hypothetical protein